MSDRSVRRWIYAYTYIDAAGPLYAIAPLYFLQAGRSAAEVSALFALWSATSLVLEVPSGTVADRVDRRWLLVVALFMRACGIAVWMVWTEPIGLALGIVLWAGHGALASGAWEALVYDELSAVGQSADYAPVMARSGQAMVLSVAGSLLVATGLLGAGVSLSTLGWITVAMNLPAAAIVLMLPRVEQEVDDEESDAWWPTMQAGIRAALSEPLVLRMVVVGALLEGLFVLDDYAPVLGEVAGVPPSFTSLLVCLVWLGLLVGGEVAARRPDLSSSTLGFTLACAAGVSLIALATGSPWGVAALGVAYGGLQLTWISYDARFQHRIDGSARATTTSVRAFGGALVNICFFVFMGMLGDDPTIGILLALALLVVIGALVKRWVPNVSPSGAR